MTIEFLALISVAALIAWLGYRFLLPEATTRVAGFSAAGSELRETARLEALIPEGAIHATYGEAYLTEDLPAVQSGEVLTDYEPEMTILAATAEDFMILDSAGTPLVRIPVSSLSLGLPVGYDAMGDDSYFYFVLDSGLGLVVRVARVLRAAGPGNNELGCWDALLL